MKESVTIPAGKLVYLEERAKKMARDKSYLQLIIRLINQVNAASGLEDTVDCMMRNILDVVGSTSIVLYYWIDNDIYSADVYGGKLRLNSLEDALVQQVLTNRAPIEVENSFSNTQLTTQEFTNAYTWVYPLLVGDDLVGILKMENLHIGMRDLHEQLPTFFNYVALVLKNEILGQARLKQAYDQLSAINEKLALEIEEREQVEEELRQGRDELEERVEERTIELQSANERLQQELVERERAQQQEHLLSSIVQSSDDAIIAKDPDGIILTWNRGAERIYGFSPDEAIGKSISILYPPGQEAELSDIMAALKKGERIEHYVTARQRKGGQRFSISLSIAPIRDTAGNIVGASSIARDITEQMYAEQEINRLNKELEERVDLRTNDLESKRSELEESQLALMNIVEDLNLKTAELEDANTRLLELDRLKSMFIASMSHELRTPLNSIIGFSSIIRDGWLGTVNPEQKENLDTIQRAGKHLLSLINDVIDVSKIEAGRIEARFEEFDLYDLLTEAVQYVEKDICEKGMKLNLQFQHHVLRTDKRRLLQCIINLLSNAVKFTEQGGITVSVSKTDIGPDKADDGASQSACAPVCITISDTGIGINAEDIPTIFEPFVRLESHLKTVAPGTGLGLYLTRKLIVEVLGGDILCNSTIGEGSTFILTIPERIYEKSTGSRG